MQEENPHNKHKVAQNAESTPDLQVEPPKKSKKLWVIITAIVVLVLIVAGLTLWLVMRQKAQTKTTTTTQSTTTQASENPAQVTSLRLDTSKDYGNKYANGILPVGDSKYLTTGAQKGTVYLCRKPNNGDGGAESRGPWFINNNTEYDINKKPAVTGNVPWQSTYAMNLSANNRVITTNDLPNNHTTGNFPIAKTDPAYQYDRNPNSIEAQSLTYTLNAVPTVGTTGCLGGEVGVMVTGVALFDAFDAGGRDAGAWEVQDSCAGHPQNSDEYHYHTLSSCIKDTSVSTVIGYALDGFAITGPKVGENNILTSSDLDECHGITSTITLDGKQVTTYHYVMTQDFPYSVSCFRSTSINAPGAKH